MSEARQYPLGLNVDELREPNHQIAPYVGWLLVAALVIGYELWALRNNRRTLSQGVQRGPLWFKLTIGIGLAAVVVHLFF